MTATRSLERRADRIPLLREILRRSIEEGCDVTALAVTSELFANYYYEPKLYADDIEALKRETARIEERIFRPKDLARLRGTKKR